MGIHLSHFFHIRLPEGKGVWLPLDKLKNSLPVFLGMPKNACNFKAGITLALESPEFAIAGAPNARKTMFKVQCSDVGTIAGWEIEKDGGGSQEQSKKLEIRNVFLVNATPQFSSCP